MSRGHAGNAQSCTSTRCSDIGDVVIRDGVGAIGNGVIGEGIGDLGASVVGGTLIYWSLEIASCMLAMAPLLMVSVTLATSSL